MKQAIQCKVNKWEFDFYLEYLGSRWVIGSNEDKDDPDVLIYSEYQSMVTAIVLVHATK